jgi:hypothetical protein
MPSPLTEKGAPSLFIQASRDGHLTKKDRIAAPVLETVRLPPGD